MADDKDSTFKDILYQLQVANEGMFDNISVLNKIEKLLDVGNMQSLAFQTAEKEGPKTETADAGDNKEVVAGLSFLADIGTSSLKTLNRIDFASDITMQRIVEMTDAAKASGLQALENNKEMFEVFKKIQEALKNKPENPEKPDKSEKPEMSWATWAVAVGAALLGFVEGFVAELAIQAKALFTRLTKLLDFGPLLAKIKGSKFVLTITRAFESIVLFGERLGAKMGDLFKMFKNSNFVTKITEGFTKVLDIGKDFGAKVKGIFTSVKSFFTNIILKIKNIATGISTAFAPVRAAFDAVMKSLGFVDEGAKSVGFFGRAIKSISEKFGFLKNIATKFFGLGKAFGSFLGKFMKFIPGIGAVVAVIVGVFDSITGFIDGFTKTEGSLIDKIVGGLKGGLTGLVNGLIGGLLDMLKGAVSWIAKALGFDGIAAALDSFSFSEILGKLIGNLVDGVVGFFTDQFAVFKVLFDNIKKMFSGEIDFKTLFLELLGGIIRTLLAPVNAIGKLAGFDITKKALSLLGLPDTGRTDVGGTPKAPKVKADAEVKPGENATETNTVTTSTSESISLSDRERLEKEALTSTSESISLSDRERLEKEALTSTSALVTNNSIVAAPGQVQTLVAPADINLTPIANVNAPMVGSDAAVLSRYAETAELEAIDSPIVGAEMNALQSDTAQAEAERASTPIVIPAPASGRGGDRKVINNSQAITYNSNNMPDRTGWMLTPQFGY
jgi:hypothetical protein